MTINAQLETTKAKSYAIRIKGFLDERRLERFEGFTATPLPNDELELVGPVMDQAALHGILNCIRDMGVPLVEVRCLENPDN